MLLGIGFRHFDFLVEAMVVRGVVKNKNHLFILELSLVRRSESAFKPLHEHLVSHCCVVIALRQPAKETLLSPHLPD